MYNIILLVVFSFTLAFSSNFEKLNETSYDIQFNKAKVYFTNKNYEESYNILKKLFLKDFTNVKVNFYLAKSAIKLKKYGIAQAAFDRILINDSSNRQAKFEEAKLMYIVENKKESELKLKKLLKEEGLTKELINSIENYLEYIDDNKKLTEIDSLLVFGVNYLDNATTSPTDKYILPNFTYLGEQGDDVVDDINFLHFYNINITKRFLDNENLKFRNSFTYFDKRFKNEKDENFEHYSYEPSLKLYDKGNIYSLATKLGRYQPGHNDKSNYFDSFNISSSVENKNYFLYLNAQRFFYREDDKKDKSYSSYQSRLQINDFYGFTLSTLFTKDIKFKSRRTDIDKIYLDSSLSYKYNLSDTVFLKPKLRYKMVNYADESIAFNTKRKDRLTEYSLETIKSINKSSYISFLTSYLDNSSNHNEYKYNNSRIGFLYVKKFILF